MLQRISTIHGDRHGPYIKGTNTLSQNFEIKPKKIKKKKTASVVLIFYLLYLLTVFLLNGAMDPSSSFFRVIAGLAAEKEQKMNSPEVCIPSSLPNKKKHKQLKATTN